MYIDAVLIQFKEGNKKYLYEAPRWTGLKPGEMVVANGQLATVVDSIGVDQDDYKLRFIACCAGATLPLAKLDGIVKPFTYEETEDF